MPVLAEKTPKFLVPKPKKKADPRDAWFGVQKRLLLAGNANRLFRCLKTLKKHRWQDCGLAIQLQKILIKRKGLGCLQLQEKNYTETETDFVF